MGRKNDFDNQAICEELLVFMIEISAFLKTENKC